MRRSCAWLPSQVEDGVLQCVPHLVPLLQHLAGVRVEWHKLVGVLDADGRARLLRLHPLKHTEQQTISKRGPGIGSLRLVHLPSLVVSAGLGLVHLYLLVVSAGLGLVHLSLLVVNAGLGLVHLPSLVVNTGLGLVNLSSLVVSAGLGLVHLSSLLVSAGL